MRIPATSFGKAEDSPSIMAAISRRTKLGLGDCRAPAKNGRY
jgi:hypothetical protein